MERGNGRVEPGQRIRGMSARAWNRAQDAADIVLGTNPDIAMSGGMPSVRSLAMPMLIKSLYGTSRGNTFAPGSVVVFSIFESSTAIRTEGELGTALTPPYEGYIQMPSAVAYVNVPLDITPLYTPKTVPAWGVTTEGGILNSSIVPVIVAGVAPVRIRSMTYGSETAHQYAIPAIRRTGAETLETLEGVLESTKCACENAAKIIFMEGQTQYASGNSSSAQCFWALVVI